MGRTADGGLSLSRQEFLVGIVSVLVLGGVGGGSVVKAIPAPAPATQSADISRLEKRLDDRDRFLEKKLGDLEDLINKRLLMTDQRVDRLERLSGR